MLLDEPRGRLRLGCAQTEARTQLARHARADDRVVLQLALADVVEERGHKERPPVLDRLDDLRRQRKLARGAAALDIGQHADGAHQMLIDRIAVVHVELRHGDDTAELGHEAAKHPGVVHTPQRRFRTLLAGQQLHEDSVGLRVGAQIVIDEAQRLAQEPDRVGMQERVGVARLGEEPYEVHAITLEHVRVGDVQPIVVDAKLGARAHLTPRLPIERPEQPAQPRRRLELLHLQGCAQDRRQIADVLGNEEVVLHEALDRAQAAALAVAELLCQPGLHVESEDLLGTAAQEVQVAADRPKEVLAAAERCHLVGLEDAGRHGGRPHALTVEVFR